MSLRRLLTDRPRAFWRLAGVAALLVLVSLLPWWRNHARLNDFYDYGLVMAGIGRIEAGERPYRDFVTPIQTGVFLANGLAETLFGGTYRGMTAGAAVAVVVSLAVLTGLLARRWGAAPALAVAAALTWATHAQHTIVWYNGVGVLLLAMATWSAAIAPVWRRADLGWHAVLALALFLGGLNKISFQLIALAFALGWAWRAGLRGRGSFRAVAATTGAIVLCGAVLPAAFEMLWTGASPAAWWHNVVLLPASGRSGDLPSILTLKFFLSHAHNYYGHLALPFVGLLGVLLSFAVLGLGWLRMPDRDSRLECALLAAAVLLAMGGGIGLLATNQDIAYVSFAGWLVLLVAVWIGFGLDAQGWLARGVLVAPVVATGLFAWKAAWAGHRALWGYSAATRTDYVEASAAGEAYGYLRGTHIPPELVKSLASVAEWRAGLSAADREAIFYGAGLEWLERVWPATKVPGLPLWFAYGTNFGQAEQAALDRALGQEGVFRHAVVSIARDVWFDGTVSVLERGYSRRLLGPVVVAYSRVLSEGVSIHPLEFVAEHGGNVDSNLLASPMGSHLAADGRQFLGVRTGRGEMTLLAPSYRLRGEAVLQRLPGGAPGELTANFAIAALPAEGAPIDLWIERHTLRADENERLVPFEVGGGGMPVRFVVTIDGPAADRVVAGWRNPTILHAMEVSEDPPRLQHTTLDFLELGPADWAALLPEGTTWRPRRMVARGGRMTPDGLELVPGGELWVRAGRPVGAFAGEGRLADAQEGREPPLVRAFYYKGGRLEITSQASTGGEGPLEFRTWSAEPDGWLVVSVAQNPRGAPVVLRITEVRE